MTGVSDQGLSSVLPRRIASPRLLIPALALAVSLAAHSAFHAAGAPTPYLLAAGAALGLILLGLVANNRNALALGAIISAIAVVAVPLFPELAWGKTPGAALHGAVVWPQSLVLLFASRLLAELNRLRFMDFWARPSGRLPSAQSFGAALCLGLSLTFLFYWQFGTASEAPAHEPLAVLRRALSAPSVLHAAIMVVFLTLMAALFDALLSLRREERLLQRLRRFLDENRPDPDRLHTIANLPGVLPPDSRVRTAVVAAASGPAAGESAAIEAVHLASRKFMRVLLSFLPLLGFLGTVVGLAIAIAGLDSRGGQAAGANLAASLAGLALQFETTLLGLLGGLLGALAIALLDKREAELLAAARHLVADYRGRTGR